MIWIVHRDKKIKDFISKLLYGDDSTKDESKTICDYLSHEDKLHIQDGDKIYGSLYMSELFALNANVRYYNITPPKGQRKNHIVWEYKVVKHTEEQEGESSVTQIGSYDVEISE